MLTGIVNLPEPVAAWHRQRSVPPPPEGGFVLVAALGMMSFVLLLILSLTLQAQVELRNASNSKARILARENARLGLMIALGNLQRHAGPDQRVTARAEVLGSLDPSTDPDGRRYWTGVWDTTAPDAPPRWLVSGNNPDLSTPTEARVVGPENVEDTPQNYVNVPIQRFEGLELAWWISDEGVKASVKEQPSQKAATLAEAIPQLQIPQRFGFEEWVKLDGDIDFAQTNHTSELEKLISINELPLALSEDDLGKTLKNEFYHDLTTRSTGLLVDTQAGGLRENLNAPISSDPEDPFLNGDLSGFADAASNFRLFNIGSVFGTVPTLNSELHRLPDTWREDYPTLDPARTDQYRAYHHLTPIITEFAIYFSVFQRQGRPSLRFYADVELYNPYSFPLLLRSDGDARALTVLVDGLPELKVSRYDDEGDLVDDSGWVSMDDLTMFASNARETGSWLTISTEPESPYSGNAYLMPGETYRLEDPDPRFQSQGLLQSFAATPQNVANNQRVLIEGRGPEGASEGRLNVRLIYGNGQDGSRPPGDPSLFEVLDIPYEGDPDLFRFNHSRADGRPPSGRGPPGPKAYIQGAGLSNDVDVLDSYIMAFHFRLGGGPDDTDLNDFLNAYDLRNPSIRYTDTFTVTDADGSTRERNISDFIHTATDFPMIPTQVEDSISGVFPGPTLDFFSDRATRLQDPEPSNAGDRYTDIRLYDVPLNGPLTVADYRHAHFVGQPPFSLTSPSGGELNRALDRFFIAKPDPDAPDTLSRENPWLTPTLLLEDDDSTQLFGTTAAARLAIDGAFNINSTSVDAWLAVLSQSSGGIEAFWSQPINDSNPNFLSLERYFSRLPSGGLLLTPGLTEDAIASSPDARREALRHGYRTLTSAEGLNQLYQLSYHIVDQLKERGIDTGRPFFSLAEFVNSGILQRAIDRVGPEVSELGIPAVSALNENRIGYEPTALRQTDLVSHLAPMMAARSDTFRIHVKAHTISEFDGQPKGTASLEAVVQRRIIAPQSLLAGATPSLDDFQRNFQIISLRWLDN